MIVGVLRHTLLHLCDLFRRRIALVALFPFGKGHAVDDFARLLLAEIAVRFGDPVGKAVAAEARRPHQINVLNVGPVLQMRDQAAEGGCSHRVVEHIVGHGDPFADLHHPVVQ